MGNDSEISSLSIIKAVGQKLLLAFSGKESVPDQMRVAIQRYKPAGFTLFRSLNVDSPSQVRQLTTELQRLAQEAGLPPFLIATDQEGGQLMAIGEGTTRLPGNLALGAADSSELARQAGEVLGTELAAMGINTDYAPCCDVNINPRNPVIGTRSFGEDPQLVAKLSAALVEGIQSRGVAASAKHFPGHGDTSSDSHLGIPVVPHNLDRLRSVELPPFSAAIQSGVRLVMTAHIALPALDGGDDLPATLSAAVLGGLLRGDLGFKGVIVTDAMDMGAIRQGEALGKQAVLAAQAGADLLLLTSNPEDLQRVHTSLLGAVRDGRLDEQQVRLSARRVLNLKSWLRSQPPQPDLDQVGSVEHRRIADRIAEASITLVRDDAGLLPIRLEAGQRLTVVLPKPADLTPADTSSYVVPQLAAEVRRFHPNLDEITVPHVLDERVIAAVLDRVAGSSLIILGTLNAFTQPGQADLANSLLASGIPTVVAALRMPYDLAAFPTASTYLCTYSIQPPSMRYLALALFEPGKLRGRLPVSIPGLYPLGFGLSR